MSHAENVTESTGLVLKDESYKVLGACMNVYSDKGVGFMADVYQDCLEIELGLQNIKYQSKKPLDIMYRGTAIAHNYVANLVCFGEIIVEVKAVKELTEEHRAEVHNCLKATGLRLGLLVNFGHYPRLQWERVVRGREPKKK